MIKKVKNVSYLIVETVDLVNDSGTNELDGTFSYAVGFIPAGAEVVSVDVTPLEAAGTLNVGINGALNKFVNAVNGAALTPSTSAVPFCAEKTEVIYLNSNTQAGKVKVRVQFFAPSEIVYEV